MVNKARFVLLLAGVCLTHTAWAQEKSFDVPASDAVHAIPEFARQAGLQIVAPAGGLKGITTPAIKGALDARAALKRLLLGTGLEIASDDGSVIILRKASKPGTARTTTEVGPPAAAGLAAAQLEEIIVTGSRIPLAAGQKPVQPVRTYTRDDIGRSGQSTIAEYLNTLPDVSTSIKDASGLFGVQPVQLHGLPAGTTLTLVDGRRLETSVLGYFDVSNIPVSAVERIEILPVGASAIYGADALAGAVNFILRKNFTGFEINASVDHAPDVNNPGVNIAWGKAWERGSVSVIASYDHRGELLGTEREPTSSTQLPGSVTAGQAAAIASTSCDPGNVSSIDGTSLPGLSSAVAGIPGGIIGKPTVSQFISTAANTNYCNFGRYTDITAESDRASSLLSAHFEFGAAVDVFAQILYSKNRQKAQSGSLITSFGGTLAAANPYNPFGEDVFVSFRNPNYGIWNIQPQSFVHPTIGLRGDIFSDWHYEVSATLSRDRIRQQTYGTDSQAITNALASGDPATALNPFTTAAPGSVQLINSLTSSLNGYFDYQLDDRTISTEALLRGPLASLPAGALQAAVGSEVRWEKQDTFSAGPGFFFSNPQQRRAYGVFGEVHVPLVASGDREIRSDRLSLTAAGRYDHSNDFGGKATWQGGFQWRLSDSISLSAGYGISYEAPQLNQLAGSIFVSSGGLGVTDPFRGNQLATYTGNVASGGNPSLKPETGNATTLTLAYFESPQGGLRASLTWYAIKIANYIGIPTLQTLVDNPTLYPGAVVRGPASAQDQQQGYLGPITQINDLYFNFGDLRVSGFDADMGYAIDTPAGQFTPSMAIAEVYKWQSSLVPGSPIIDGLGQETLAFFGVGWAPRWKGSLSLTWKRGALSTSLSGRYVSRYLDNQIFVPNGNELGDFWVLDTNARYEAGQNLASRAPWLAHAFVSLAAVNLFNKKPPLAFNAGWYDPTEYDIRGRYLRLIVGARF
jgi:iron complex outermembrane recepter protein